jgi:superfamily II DNA or RNA helicase
MSDLFNGNGTKRKVVRPHQEKAISMIRQSLGRGNKRVILQAGTGFGKTFVSASIIRSALAKGKRVVFTVPRTMLVNQTIREFEAEGINHIGVIQADHPRCDYDAPVQIASVQTMQRRGVPTECDLVLVDEAHLSPNLIYAWMRACPSLPFVGLTATPWMAGMGDHWQDLVMPISLRELIEQGYLSPFTVYAPSHPDLSGVGTTADDYKQGELSEVMQENRLVADVVETWKQRAQGLPTLIFAVDLAHAKKIQGQFAEAGINMGYVEANTDAPERQFLLDQMSQGKLAGIVSVGTMTTGVDADVRCVVLARPTKSEPLFVQMIGRGLRTAPGKEKCVILDHADNHARLGFVTDIHHEELRKGKEKPKPKQHEKPERLPRECPSCGTLRTRGPCPGCGFEPTRQSDLEFEEGVLREITPQPKPERESKPNWNKQDFWSMALWLDRQRGRGGKLAKGLYKGHFGVWPRNLVDTPLEPTEKFFSYEKSRRIAYAKSQEARS